MTDTPKRSNGEVLRLDYLLDLAHNHSEHLVDVLITWHNFVHYVSDLNKCSMLIDLIWEIERHKAHTIWR